MFHRRTERPSSQKYNCVYTRYHRINQPSIATIFKSNENRLSHAMIDPFEVRLSKRVNYKFPDTKRVIDSSLLDQERQLRRNMSASCSSTNTNGAWNNLISRTDNEASLTGNTRQRNPRLHQSRIFEAEIAQEPEKRQLKISQYTDHGKTTQISHLPGGIKRKSTAIADDKKTIPSEPHYATIMKHHKDFGPVYVPFDSTTFKGVNVYLGTYATRYRNESHVLVNSSFKHPDAFEVYKGKNCNVKGSSSISPINFGAKSMNCSTSNTRRNYFKSQIVLS